MARYLGTLLMTVPPRVRMRGQQRLRHVGPDIDRDNLVPGVPPPAGHWLPRPGVGNSPSVGPGSGALWPQECPQSTARSTGRGGDWPTPGSAGRRTASSADGGCRGGQTGGTVLYGKARRGPRVTASLGREGCPCMRFRARRCGARPGSKRSPYNSPPRMTLVKLLGCREKNAEKCRKMQKKWPVGHLLGDVEGVMPGVTRNPAPTESTRGPTRPLRSAGLSPAKSPSVPLRKGGSPPGAGGWANRRGRPPCLPREARPRGRMGAAGVTPTRRATAPAGSRRHAG